MKLTEKDINMLQSLNKRTDVKDFLERKKVDVFAGGNVSKEGIDEANGRVKELDNLLMLIATAEARQAPKQGEWE